MHSNSVSRLSALSLFVFVSSTCLWGADADTVLDLWTEAPPGETLEVGPEQDFTKPTDRLIAGRRIIKLGNVKTPQIHVYRPKDVPANGSAVVICPGGGWSILAWDLEGTEVAEWLNSLGVTGIVLKYRVPTRTRDPRWLAPVQDAQRALRLTRHHSVSWGLDENRIGVLGFSAGGHTAAMASLLDQPKYEASDRADQRSHRPDFAVLVYPGGLVTRENTALLPEVEVTPGTPPTFFAHAFDDGVRVENSLLLALAMKQANVPYDLHIYSEGGHGYGLRETDQPVTSWHRACQEWLRVNGWLD